MNELNFDNPQPGVYFGVPAAVYHALPLLSSSKLKAAHKSALHFRYYMDHPPQETDTLVGGSAAHTAVLEPAQFMVEYALWSRKTDAGKSAPRRGQHWDEFKAENPDKTILTPTVFDTAIALRDAAHAHPTARRWLSNGKSEVTIIWRHERTGLLIKTRIDYLRNDRAIDLKTGKNETPALFAKDMAYLGAHLQFALYSDAVTAMVGNLPFCAIAIAKAAPHDVVCYEVDNEDLLAGCQAYEDALDLIVECEKNDVWPGAYPEPQPLRFPSWIHPSEDDVPLTFGGQPLEVAS